MPLVKRQMLQFGFSLLFSLLILSGCNVYNTMRIEEITSKSMESLYKDQKTVVIHDNREENEFILTNFKIENDSLKGDIISSPTGRTHQHHKKCFGPSKVSAYNPLAVMHVYSRSVSLKTGFVAIPLSSIRFVEIHESDAKRSIVKTVGVVAGAAIISVLVMVLLSV